MRAKLDSNEASLAGARLNECRAVSVSNEIEPLLVADLDFPASDRNKRIFARNDELGAAVRRNDAAVSCGQSSRAFKDPKGLDIRLQLMPGVNER